jgi:hypothetical protein
MKIDSRTFESLIFGSIVSIDSTIIQNYQIWLIAIIGIKVLSGYEGKKLSDFPLIWLMLSPIYLLNEFLGLYVSNHVD